MEDERQADDDQDPRTGRRLRGLSWDKKNSLWRVRIYYGGKLRFVGELDSLSCISLSTPGVTTEA
eukprot:gene5985-6224_t